MYASVSMCMCVHSQPTGPTRATTSVAASGQTCFYKAGLCKVCPLLCLRGMYGRTSCRVCTQSRYALCSMGTLESRHALVLRRAGC